MWCENTDEFVWMYIYLQTLARALARAHTRNCGFFVIILLLFAIILLTSFFKFSCFFIIFPLHPWTPLPVCKWDLDKCSCTEQPEFVLLICLQPTLCWLRCRSAIHSASATLSVVCIYFPFLQSQCSSGSPQFKLQSGSALLSWTTIWTEARKSGAALGRMETWLCSNLLKEEKAVAAAAEAAAAAVIITSWSFNQRLSHFLREAKIYLVLEHTSKLFLC